ncbi:MAG: Chromosome segregation ATPase-like protein [Chthoniobacteraceae bacterium]|nr:Chromosome segregation ATPase-like protein [Chthoniobacteraceae bacterium]
MDEIKFHCPECKQKIGVQSSDAGRQMDCPICQSAIIIPERSNLPVRVIAARKSTQAVDPERNPKDFQETIRIIPQAHVDKPQPASPPELNTGPQSEVAEARLKAELENSALRLKELLTERGLLANRFTEVTEQAAQSEMRLKGMSEKNEALEKECIRLRTQLAEASRYERENGELRFQLAGQEKQIASVTGVSNNQRIELANAEKELIKARADLDAARMQIQNLRRQLREVGEHFGDSERERVLLLRQLQESVQHHQLTTLTNELGEARARLLGQLAELDLVKAERDALLEQLRQRDGAVSHAPALEVA